MTAQEIINGLNDYIEHPTYMIDPDLLDELKERMDRIKVLMDASGESIEEMLARSPVYTIQCDKCPISNICCELGTVTNKKTGLIYGCSDVWEKYLKGENDAKET